jgi:hypothetical protein
LLRGGLAVTRRVADLVVPSIDSCTSQTAQLIRSPVEHLPDENIQQRFRHGGGAKGVSFLGCEQPGVPDGHYACFVGDGLNAAAAVHAGSFTFPGELVEGVIGLKERNKQRFGESGSAIAKLKGIVEISSEVGRGTIMTMKVPLTLAILQGLLVKVASEIFAIPLNAVLEVLRVKPEEIDTIKGREVIRLRNSVLPLARVCDIIGKSRSTDNVDTSYVVIVGWAEKMSLVTPVGMTGPLLTKMLTAGFKDYLEKRLNKKEIAQIKEQAET